MTARLFTGGRLLRPDPAPAAIDSLAVAGGNIIDARIHTARNGTAVDNFLVQDPLGRPFGLRCRQCHRCPFGHPCR